MPLAGFLPEIGSRGFQCQSRFYANRVAAVPRAARCGRCRSTSRFRTSWTRAADAERVDELSIGVSQYPSTFNPLTDPLVAKSYVLAMVRRPLTTYDSDWKLVCMLCETVPSFENGLARKLDLPGGKHGVRLTYTLKAGLKWGDGQPVTTDDVIFSWQVGRNPQTGVADAEIFRRMVKVEAQDARRLRRSGAISHPLAL